MDAFGLGIIRNLGTQGFSQSPHRYISSIAVEYTIGKFLPVQGYSYFNVLVHLVVTSGNPA
ncbi:hypothetical protein D3C80_2164840 [compost metagenome]